MKFSSRPSINEHDDLCEDIIDKENGNLTVAHDVWPEYQNLLGAAPDLLVSLKEMRDACAACMRIIYRNNLTPELERELNLSKIQNGFGVRADQAIEKAEGND